MHLLHTALYALLGAAFVFAVIELGLTAYVESQYESYDSVYYSYGETIKISSPPIVGFLIFCSVWTMLVTGGALFSSWFFTRRGSIARSVSFIISIVHLLVYFMTMVFWLAGFADMAALLGGFYASDYANAIIAFAVLLWLIFFALLVLNILAVLGILTSDWAGYTPYKERSGAEIQDTPMQTAPAPAPAPVAAQEPPYPVEAEARV